MKRRDFLTRSAMLTGTVIPAWAWGQAKPCPPATFSVSGGSATGTTCQASVQGLPSLILTSGASSGTYGWTVGQAIRKGDVPSGSVLKVNGGESQCEVRNRWPDGSAKFAVISGVSSFSGGQPKVVSYAVEKDAASGAAVAEPASIDCSVTFSGTVSGTYELQSVLGINKSTWNDRTAGGRVRSETGPVMSEFHYYRPTNDPHVTIWWYVRAYSNGAVEVETVIENGWLNVASPGHKTYDVSVRVGGSQRYSASITHRHHTRWSRVDWVGTDPKITPQHDAAYLRAAHLVPNYGWGNPSDAVLNALFQDLDPTPMSELGGYPSGYFSGGDKPTIGLLPHWAALWAAASGMTDGRAYRSIVANARVSQRYAVFYRDETTGRAPRMATNAGYANIGLATRAPDQAGIDDAGNSRAYIPATTGSFGPADMCDRDHAAQDTYVAYLATGRWPFMEHAQIKQMTYALAAGSTARNYNDCQFNGPETRGRGWVMRDCALALSITPDDDPFRTELQTVWQNNMAWLRSSFVDPTASGYEPAGWMGHYSATGDSAYGGTAYWWDAPWMHWFGLAAIGFARQLELPVSAQAVSNLDAILAHNSKIVSGMLGDGLNGNFSYRRAAQYSLPIGSDGVGTPPENKFTWPQVWETLVKEKALPALPDGNTLLMNDNQEVPPNYFDCAGDNLGHLIAAAAMVSNYNSAAKAGYMRLASSSTWQKHKEVWNNTPKTGITPH